MVFAEKEPANENKQFKKTTHGYPTHGYPTYGYPIHT